MTQRALKWAHDAAAVAVGDVGVRDLPTRRLAVAVLGLLVIGASVAPAAAAGVDDPPTVGGEGQLDAPAADEVRFAYTFERLPARPGEVRVHVETTAPEQVTSVTVQPPAGATVESATGYDPAAETTGASRPEWTWERPWAGDGGDAEGPAANASATITYVVDVNRTDGDELEATGTGEWALFNWRAVDLQWAYDRPASTAEPTVTERAAGVAGDGIVGPGYAYLGPAETYRRTVDGETIRLVVPEAAIDGMAESPTRIMTALAAASRDLRVGARNERVTVFVAPSPIDAAGRLSRAGPTDRIDAYVGADEPLDTPDNAWLHEYVHARQAYRTSERAAWLDDALAEYYAALLTYEQGRISEAAFYEYVRTNESADATLTETAAGDAATYEKGRRVLAGLDAVVRADSGGTRSLQDVFASLNDAEGRVDVRTLRAVVAAAGRESTGAWVTRYTGTSATPPVPATLSPPVTAADSDVAGRALDAPPLGQLLFVVGGGLTVLAAATMRRRDG